MCRITLKVLVPLLPLPRAPPTNVKFGGKPEGMTAAVSVLVKWTVPA